MRSISLINHQNYNLPEFNSNEVKLAHDPVNNITYLVGLNSTEETCRVWSYKTEGTNKIYKEIIDFPFMNLDDQTTHLTGFDYLVNSELLCVALSNGDIITIDINQSMPQTDVVGTVDFGILSMIWSLDQELVAIITGHENFLLMTKDFEVIKEQPLHLDDQGIEIPVSVGWGKKETQFHGSVGKQAAKEKVNVADFTLSKDEDHLPKVSWRGDGSYLVISIINPLTGIRQLKVFSREGDLINVSEPVDKLEHLVNWRPSGNLITCSQRSPPNRHEIIFFERNGLRHGEFTLPKNVEKLIQIGWNCDSTILGLLLIYNNPNGLQDYRLQLWTMGNYHYYLKQEIIIGLVGSGQVNEIEFVWDTERFNGLNIAYLGNIHSILLHLEALTSSVLTPIEPMGLVSVVDGSQLLITPYKYKNVPPPMSAYQIPTQSQIQHVSYSTFNHGNDILVLLNDNKVGLITFDGPKSAPALGAEFLDLNSLDLPQINYRQITYPKKDEIYLLGYSEDVMSDIVVRVQIECSDNRWNSEVKVVGQTFNTIDSSIIKLNHFENLPYPLIQDSLGDFYQVKYENNEIKFTQGIDQLPAFKFPEACSRYSVFKGNDSDDEIYFVGLSSRNKLYINDQLVESGCTSFTMHNEFLLFTTSDHLVKFIYWKGLYENQFNIQNYVNLLEPYHRKLERGSKLVVTAPGDVNVVLQMPRGNLETVYPRALVVANVLNHVTDLRYDLAFTQCRKHRIDHNIIYDFNPQQLLDNLTLFVDQVKDPDYLNLFLSSMTNKNVLKELYPPMMPKGLEDGDKLAELFANKRDLLCIGVRDVLRTKPGKEYYPTVMTTYVRQVPPNLEDALELLKSIKVNDIDLAEETLKYAIFLVNVEQLFDCALGLYDFELVLMVAQQSNMDPKEYLPFLDGLKQFKAPYQYFKIDDHLKRHEKALSHLYNSGDDYWTEFLNYCKANTLYTTALNLASKNNEQLKQIRKIYGDHLISLKDYLNAGPMYLLCEEYESALLCFVKLGNWQFAYQCARQLKYTEEKTNELIKDLVDKLKDQEKFGEAAKLIMDHFNDPEEALPIFIEGRLWSDGLYLCHFHNRLDLIETDLQPQVTEGYDQLFEDISDMLTQFRKQSARLDELRKELTQVPVYDNIQNNEALDNVDITSEASTNITNFTVYTKISSQASTVTGSVRTGKTSRDRKRAAKSKQKGKKGSYHEEEYLIGSIGRLVKRFNDLQKQVHSMLMILVNFGTISKAQTLQKEYLALELELTSKLDQVYEFSPRLQAELKEATTPQDPGLDKVNLVPIKWKLEILN